MSLSKRQLFAHQVGKSGWVAAYGGKMDAAHQEELIKMDMIVQFRNYCRAFQRIQDQGENYDRDEALELISEMLNNNHNTERTTLGMCAALARSTISGEIDDDAQQEWDDTQEFLNDNA